MAILNNNPLVGASGNQGGYNINNSLRFRSSASAYLSRTPASAGTSNKIMTISLWVKRGLLGAVQTMFGANNGGNTDNFRFTSNDQLDITFQDTGAGQVITTQVFRDPSAWYHIVLSIDTTQSTSTNRVKMYVNGVQITSFSTASYPAQNTAVNFTSNVACTIGRYANSGVNYFDGYMAEQYFIDGQALTPSSFGETDTTTGVWKPKAYTGTYGTNGFYLKFSDIATTSGSNAGLGKDFSGNGNYWTTNNISVTSGTTYDAMTDSPTLTSATVANYAVLNPTIANTTNLINANLTRNGAVRTNVASMVCTNGKYYFETTIQDSNGNGGVGVKQTTAYPLEDYDTSKCALYFSNGEYKIEGGAQTSGFSTFTNGDVIGIAIDTTLSTPKIWFAKNNTWQGTGDPTTAGYSLTSGLDYYFAILHGSSASSTTASANFGQRPFAYTPPTGYKALNTYNLPDSTIKKGNSYMDATLYTGTGSSLNVTGVNFQPDFVWIKERVGAADHGLYDAVRGVQKQLESNTATAETTETTGLTAFNSDGFTVGALAQLNTNTDTYVAWSWKANGAGSSNTSGSITSTVSVNTTAGFSVVTYTGNATSGATVGHGLGVAPKMIIFKGRSSTFDWMVYHTSLGNTNYLRLNQTDASAASVSAFNNTSPTSTVFSLGDGSLGNAASATQVAYCWAEIAGFSKFGSYTGGGNTGASTPNANGPFIYLGFRPKFVLIKRTSSAADWVIYDSSRGTYNANYPWLYPNLSSAEVSTEAVDFLSNGFKIRSESGATMYPDGATFIYAAFAENPFKNSLAR